mgnify:CR=1 FL=1
MLSRRCLAFCWFVLGTTAFGQSSYPMVTHCTPVAIQRGTETEIVVDGQMNFAGIHKAIIEGKGVSAEVVGLPPAKEQTPTAAKSTKLKFKATQDAALGVREFRLASALGISTLGQILVVADPIVLEGANNDTRDKAQGVQVPCVISGRIEIAEDVDHFKFTAKAGQTLTFEVFCARIQDKIHDLQKHADPMLLLFDSTGRELAANDDGVFADPQLTFTLPQDGEYFVQLRDAKYDGDPRWAYALSITDRPRVSQVFPFAGNPGKVLSVEPVGSAKKMSATGAVKLPEELGIHSLAVEVGKEVTNPTAFVVTSLPLTNEQEPNDIPSQANKCAVPCGINGRIGQKRDLDHFVIKGTKGKALRLEVFARRFGSTLNSQLDAMLDILSPTGAVLASNDDANGKDSALVYTPTVDGDLVVRLRDLNNKGGEGYVYYLEIDYAKPDFTIRCDPSKVMMGPGSRAAMYIQIARLNGFIGPVKVDIAGLPKSVTVNPLTIPATMTQGLLVLSASADAPLDLATIQVTGSAESSFEGKPLTLTRIATAVEEIYSPGGGRGKFDVRMQSVAVTGPSDILEVQVKPEKLVLKPGEEIKLEVTLKRRADYDKAVSIDVLLRHLGTVFGNPLPPGVTIVEGKSKTLLGTGNVGHVTLKVDATAAPIDDVPISVLAHVSINFVVKVSYSSAPILLTIKK